MTDIKPEMLDVFSGYLDLKMFGEANEELENLPNEYKVHPTILLARLELLTKMEKWEEGVILAQSLCKLWPEQDEFYFELAYCLHELKRTAQARETLLSGPETLQSDAHFYYNLACYEAQLGNINEAKRRLSKCFEMDKSFKSKSLDDPDLQPLWDASSQ